MSKDEKKFTVTIDFDSIDDAKNANSNLWQRIRLLKSNLNDYMIEITQAQKLMQWNRVDHYRNLARIANNAIREFETISLAITAAINEHYGDPIESPLMMPPPFEFKIKNEGNTTSDD